MRARKQKRNKKREVVMDNPTSRIVSYLCGLNAQGSWPPECACAYHKGPTKEEEEGTLKLLHGQVHR